MSSFTALPSGAASAKLDEPPKTAKAGSLIRVDSGEYSDYGVRGFFVALQDFQPMEELKRYLEANPSQKEPYEFQDDAFLAELIRNGFLLEITHSQFYLGAYHKASEVAFYETAGW